jgi:hypothetical protein
MGKSDFLHIFFIFNCYSIFIIIDFIYLFLFYYLFVKKEKTMNQKKKNWIVDLVCFVGFLLSLKPSITGFSIHEWLGIAVCGVLIVHLLMHWRWTANVTKNFGKVKFNVQFNYVVDVMLGLGFALILATGLIISNLLSLAISYDFFTIVRVVHVFSSYATFALVMVKLAKHFEWIAKVTASMFGISTVKKQSPNLAISTNEAVKTEITKKNVPVNPARREAMRMFLIGGAGVALAGKWTVDWGSEYLVAAEGVETVSSTSVIATATSVMAVLDPLLANVSQCHKGLQCVYPGSCHDYQDINGNNICDHGEVLAYNIAQGTTTEDSFGALPEGGNQNGNGHGRGQKESESNSATTTTDTTSVATATSVPTATPTAVATTETVIVVEPTADVLANVPPCRKGLHCSYPGKCHDYQDINSNGLCDRGEVS